MVEQDSAGAVRPVNRFYQGSWPDPPYRFFQIAWLVDDLVTTCRRWVDVYGVGPFHILPKRMGKVHHRGVDREVELQLGIAQAGPVQIELIQQTAASASIYRDVYPEGSRGLHHLCTITHDFDGTRAHYEGKGYKLAALIESPAMRVGYFDTHADFGFITEVVEHEPGFVAALETIADTCRTWDGSDPVRILMRGGYRTPEGTQVLQETNR